MAGPCGYATAAILALLVALAIPFTRKGHTAPRFDIPPSHRGGEPGDYLLNEDGLWLFTRKWEIENPKAVVFLTHGYGEHSGRYHGVAAALNKAGLSVYAVDLPGHGRSEGDRMVCSTTVEFPSAVLQLIDATPVPEGMPVFLLGHSLGGMTTLLTAASRPTAWRGVVLSAPLIYDSVPLPLPRETLIKLGGPLATLLPKLPISHVVLNHTTRNQEVLAEARADQFNAASQGTPVRVQCGMSILKTCEDITKSFDKFTFPFLVQHGTDDKIVKLEGSEELYAKAASKDKTIKTYPGLYHELYFEPESEQTIGDMIEWVVARL